MGFSLKGLEQEEMSGEKEDVTLSILYFFFEEGSKT